MLLYWLVQIYLPQNVKRFIKNAETVSHLKVCCMLYSVFSPILWHLLLLTVCDPLLTLIQCALLHTVLFCRAYQTLPQHLDHSLRYDDCCTQIYFLVGFFCVKVLELNCYISRNENEFGIVDCG